MQILDPAPTNRFHHDILYCKRGIRTDGRRGRLDGIYRRYYSTEQIDVYETIDVELYYSTNNRCR